MARTDFSARTGRSCGSIRHDAPARTSQRSALNTSRRLCARCGASSASSARYGATSAHSSSATSLGYGFRSATTAPPHVRTDGFLCAKYTIVTERCLTPSSAYDEAS